MLNVTIAKEGLKELPEKYVCLVLTEESVTYQRLVETSSGILEYRMGVGKFGKVTPRTYRTLVRSIVRGAKSHQVEYLTIDFSILKSFSELQVLGDDWLASTLAENILLADYEFHTYKTKSKSKRALKEVVISGLDTTAAKTGLARGLVVGEYVNKAREITNTPACDMTPTHLGEAAKQLAKGTKLIVKVLGEKELKKLKMGSLLAVGQGTKSETKLIVAEYWGAGKVSGKKVEKDKQPAVLVGKGITYDTGGLNVKPSGGMHDMHMDMTGGSTVLAAIACAAKLGLKKNIVAIVPAAENSVSDDAMRAGDIVTAMNGKTIEVLHTDAEGRMVLADGLTYSERYNPRVILDVATLTGAALVALGQHASAIMTKDEELERKLRDFGEESGDLVWPLPLWDEYKQHIKSSRADVSNIAANFSRFGGTIEGATFLSFFAPKNVPWAHIDIAPRMESIPSDKLAKGATGEPVRLLVKFLESY
ncbi:MAG: leucyl aminopeptidase family protein [Candidatus Nomurabacteria bacterium]|nr:leucyl aminopeptidase family protein [Candidatus Nomurabacteria bacterium]USN87907.1 MAG: leucyl aminopeptidase family protein [Candidatus Nomurabacteria bacterium]